MNQSDIEHDHAHNHAHDDEHDLGLAHDLSFFTASRSTASESLANRSVDRRHFLKYAAGLGVVGFAVLGTRKPANAQNAAACADIPEETGGPFPGDGTNGPNVLSTSGVVRSDIRTSFASIKGVAAGVPLTITLTLTDAAQCAPANGYAVYVWHADQAGRYSLYSAGATDQNYLRGVQVANEKGEVSFTTVFPGCYDGRWPHVHFEVYPSLEAAGDASKRIATSQLAFPKDSCVAAYAAPGYSASVSNLKRQTLSGDMVFGDDGAAHQLATMSGSVTDGFIATLPVSVSNTTKASGGGPGGSPGGGPRKPKQQPTTTLAKRSTKTTTKTKTTKQKKTK